MRLKDYDISTKTKAKVRSEVAEIAQELVVLYQRRVTTPGHAFAPDTPWQREMEDSFGYEETPDQLQAILDAKSDMERDVLWWSPRMFELLGFEVDAIDSSPVGLGKARALAAHRGVAIHAIEAAKYGPSLELAIKIAEVFGVAVDDDGVFSTHLGDDVFHLVSPCGRTPRFFDDAVPLHVDLVAANHHHFGDRRRAKH